MQVYRVSGSKAVRRLRLSASDILTLLTPRLAP